MTKKLYKIAIAFIFFGLGAAILHPYVHVLKNDLNASHHQTHSSHQTFDDISSAESCYVCTFSKTLKFGETTTPKVHFLPFAEANISIPTFFRNFGFEHSIYLRAPPRT